MRFARLIMMNKKTKKKLFEFKLRHILYIIIVTIVISVVGALIINIFYSLGKNGNAIHTEWQASDTLIFFATILEALGTISLGAISIWQNQQLQKSNEEAQVRIEKISIHANEVNITSQIVNYEETRLKNIEKYTELFIQTCNVDTLLSSIVSGCPREKYVEKQKNEFNSNYLQVKRGLISGFYKGDKLSGFKSSMDYLFLIGNICFDNIKENKPNYAENIITNTQINLLKISMDQYLMAAYENIHRIILGEISLEQIKNQQLGEVTNNGQAENAQQG